MQTPLWLDIVLFLIGMAMMVLIFYGFIRLGRRVMRKPTELAFVGRMKGPSVPVAASFTGLTFLPWVAITSNNLNPLLAIHPDRIEYRALRLRTRPISDIADVDVQLARGTVNLVFRFRDSSMTFIANVGQQALAAQALAALPETVSLTPAARKVLDKAGPVT
ncbi:hypothetical protein FXN63_03365 [Pigmentiphaga aceris]|uniref:Uncharacterized protein n=1 Tax=Pigmentiphaga aceris TaxID=1940612 RepID=A0A5C0AXA6_9BURK|nr:hypothetical protein [Pigmentiphaga aceris]QEI04987.1 hypothetical protein FXN63_03365 [Pigmentiphaga aceris]